MSGAQAGLRLADLRIALEGRHLLAVDACVGPGEVLTLMGPSGIGKSTLLAYVAGFADPAFAVTGEVYLDGAPVTDLPPQARHIGLLFQDDLLFPHMSVAQNLQFAVPPQVPRPERRQRVRQALADAELTDFGPRDPATLSGGQRARVALLRVLLSRPRALLLDEPFAKLDMQLRDQIRRLVFGEARKRRLPVLLVTHDPRDAEAAGGRVIDLGNPSPQ